MLKNTKIQTVEFKIMDFQLVAFNNDDKKLFETP